MKMSEDDDFILSWDIHEKTRTSKLKSLWENNAFLDVTIACDDDQIDAHKVILSAASPFFETILKRNPHNHPLLYLRGTRKKDLEALLCFIYSGETQIINDELEEFMALANSLQVQGLVGAVTNILSDKEEASEKVSKRMKNDEPRQVQGVSQENNMFVATSNDNEDVTMIGKNLSEKFSSPKTSEEIFSLNDISDRIVTTESNTNTSVKTTYDNQDVETNNILWRENFNDKSNLSLQIYAGEKENNLANLKENDVKKKKLKHKRTEKIHFVPNIKAEVLNFKQETVRVKEENNAFVDSQTMKETEIKCFREDLEEPKAKPLPSKDLLEYDQKVKELITKTEEGWLCLNCSYVSKIKGHVTEHAETHVVGYSHECQFCGKTFSKKRDLRHHVRKCRHIINNASLTLLENSSFAESS